MQHEKVPAHTTLKFLPHLCPGRVAMPHARGGIGGGGGGGGAGEGGGGGQRLPQSRQSDPNEQVLYSAPGPPSSQSLSLAWRHEFAQHDIIYAARFSLWHALTLLSGETDGSGVRSSFPTTQPLLETPDDA